MEDAYNSFTHFVEVSLLSNVTSISTQFTHEQMHNSNVMFSLILEHDLMR